MIEFQAEIWLNSNETLKQLSDTRKGGLSGWQVIC